MFSLTVFLVFLPKDSVIYERLHPNDPLSQVTEGQLETFAVDGLRTLCVTEAILETDIYEVSSAYVHSVCACVCMW